MPIEAIIGDYGTFVSGLSQKLYTVGINISSMELSHIAYRTETIEEYEVLRDQIAAYCIGNVENVWNGRPISKLLLREPLVLKGGFEVSLIELIPPVHQRHYPMGMEHIGVVIGKTFEKFKEQHKEIITGQQDQGPFCYPVYITFENNTTVKFYRYSLKDVVEKEGRSFVA